MKKLAATTILSFLIWVIVTWTFDLGSILAGVFVSVLVGWAFRGVEMDEVAFLLDPRRVLWMLVYIPVLFWLVVKANFDVAYRVIHPKLPIRPGIVRVRTSLKSIPARVMLANSVTLTPGTLAVDLEDDVLYIHRIWVPERAAEEATTAELEPFERLLRRIFE